MRELFEKMETNKVEDTLNRFEKIKKSEFSIINNKILSTNKLKNIIYKIITKFNKNEIKSNSIKILELIKYLYELLKVKNEEIKNDN